MAVREFNAFR